MILRFLTDRRCIRLWTRLVTRIAKYNQVQCEYKHLLTFRVRRYVVIATKPVHRLQIRTIVRNYRAPLPFPQVTSGCVQ